mgnify:CR=1 FL=1
MEGFGVQEYRVGSMKDVVLLKASGYIDTNTSPELQRKMGQVIDDGGVQLIVDMGAVQYVSSAGWGVFVGEIRRVQEKGGDLKITQMSPEVYEVFEMLEFHRIISSFDNLEEAILDFDFCRDVLVPEGGGAPSPETERSASESFQSLSPPPTVPHATPQSAVIETPVTMTAPKQPPEMNEKRLPVQEKIKKIVLENPMLGLLGIKKMLFSPRFGYTKVGFLELRSILKRLSLHTKAKRYRYYRSR